MSPIFLTPAQAAERLGGGMKESTLRRKAQAKVYPHHKVGRLLRFTEADLERIARMTAVEPTNPYQTTKAQRAAS